MSIQQDNLFRIATSIRSSNGESNQIAAKLFYQKILQLKRYMWSDSNLVYCEPKAMEAVYVARTYWIARAAGRSFTYTGGQTFLNGAALNNSSGSGQIDCSTFIHLVMRGITYDKSPYTNTTANATYNAANLATNTEYSWADDHIRSSSTIGGMVRYAADLAAYYWAAGRAFKDASKRKPGDLIFHSTEQNDRFMSITHVSIVSEDVDAYYNVTNIENTVVRTQYANRNEDIVFFARPDYERIADNTYTFDPNFNYLAYPWICGNSESFGSGVSMTADSSGLTTSCSGATSATQINLVSSAYPLYLPAGSYKLSGAPGYQDRRARVDYSYWGLRLYPSDGRTITSQVTGYTSPSYGSAPTDVVTQSQALVWDKGWGATFTISSGMGFYSNIYISKNPTVTAYNTTDTWRPTLTRYA